MILVQYHNVCIRTLFLWCNKHVLWPRSTWSTLTHMFITGWSMFQKCHLCIFRTNLVSLPSLTAQLKTRKFLFSFSNSMAHWPFHMVASDLADWTPAAIEGQSFLHCAFLEKYGVATENMPFFIVLLLVTRYAWDAVVIAVRAHGFFCVPKYKGRRWRDKLNLDVTLSRQSGQKNKNKIASK